MKEGLLTNKYKYEGEVKTVLSKMTRALTLIENKNNQDARLPRMKDDLSSLSKQFSDMVFWEYNQDLSKMSDEEWIL